MQPQNRNYQPQSVQRPTTYTPLGQRAMAPNFGSAPMASSPEPTMVAPNPVSFAPQPAPEPQAPAAAESEQLTYTPPANPKQFVPAETKPAPKKPREPLNRLVLAASSLAVLGIVMISLGYLNLHKVSTGPAIKLAGRAVAIANPTLAGARLQTSCYALDMPASYKVINSSGCTAELGNVTGKQLKTIMVSGASVAGSVPLKDAPNYLATQIKGTIKNAKLTDVKVSDVKLDGLVGIKMTYRLNNAPTQAVVYVTDLPAQYAQSDQKIGSFGIAGAYDTNANKVAFDSIVSSFHWVK